MTEIKSYEQANEYLGKKNSRPIRYKTRVERLLNETIAIRHHDTDIIMYRLNGVVVIDTQGWHTSTTKDRLNAHLPIGFFIFQTGNIWYIERTYWDGEFDCRVTEHQHVFADGMKILPDGTIEGAGPPIEELKKLNKEILKYSRDYIKALFAGEVPKPSGGDCWDCFFKTQTGQTMGEKIKSDHLKFHIDQKYYVPSLLVRAIELFPVSIAANDWLNYLWNEGPEIASGWYQGIADRQLRSSLKRYLRRQLGLAS